MDPSFMPSRKTFERAGGGRYIILSLEILLFSFVAESHSHIISKYR